jgi:hypothetical protein
VRDANFGGVLQRNGVRSVRWITRLAAIGIVAGVVAACVELPGSLGSDCLKDQDCQSGVCSQLRCVAVPPLLSLDAEAPGPDAGDATVDGPANGPDASGTPVPDASMPADAAPAADAPAPPVDAPADAIEEGPAQEDAPADAPADAPVDAPGDARLDAGEAG